MKFLITLLLGLTIFNCGSNNTKDAEPSAENFVNAEYDATQDTLFVAPKDIVVVIPYSSEIDSLKKLWGEEKFYTIADDENARLSNLYEVLEKDNIQYTTTQDSIFNISGKIIKKRVLSYSWGVLTVEEGGNYNFKSTTDFLIDKKETLKARNQNTNTKIANHWYGNYTGTFLRIESEAADPRSRATVMLKIARNGGIFKLDSYVENVEATFSFSENDNSTLKLVDFKIKNGKESTSQLGRMVFKDSIYFLKSPYINALMNKGQSRPFELKLSKKRIQP